MAKCDPAKGGCWFCCTDDETGDWLFSGEFDTYLHKHCLEAAIASMDDENIDREAEIMAREFNL